MIQWLKTLLGRQKPRLRMKRIQGDWHVALWTPASFTWGRFIGWHWDGIVAPPPGKPYLTREEAEKYGRDHLNGLVRHIARTLEYHNPADWAYADEDNPEFRLEETPPNNPSPPPSIYLHSNIQNRNLH